MSGRRCPIVGCSADFKFDNTTVNASRISVDISTGHDGFLISLSGFCVRLSFHVEMESYFLFILLHQ